MSNISQIKGRYKQFSEGITAGLRIYKHIGNSNTFSNSKCQAADRLILFSYRNAIKALLSPPGCVLRGAEGRSGCHASDIVALELPDSYYKLLSAILVPVSFN